MPQSNWLNPFAFWAKSDNTAPLSGDVSQLFRFFSPTVNVTGRGDPALEEVIVRDVATYGSQLGQLTDIVLRLASDADLHTEAVTKLKTISKQIEAKKKEYRLGAAQRARKALQDLQAADPRELRNLLRDFEPAVTPVAEPPSK